MNDVAPAPDPQNRPVLCLAQDPAADALLSRDPFALLAGMLLDQQFPMERAFAGPALLAQRLGAPERLDPGTIVATPDDVLRAAAQGPPAIHRYPGAMVLRIKTLAVVVCEDYDGAAERLWLAATTGPDLVRALRALPGFGDQKSRIFTALLGKQLGIRPDGWQDACAPYGAPGTRMSVADVRDPATLAEVRSFKRSMKQKD